MATKQFVEVFGIVSPDSLDRYEKKLNAYLEEGSKIVHIHSIYRPTTDTGGEILTTVVFEAEQPEGE